MSKKLWINPMIVLAVVCAMNVAVLAQDKPMSCEDSWSNGDRVGHCVMKEQTIPATGSLSVDGKKNGGVSVKGWDRASVLVRAKIQSWADNKAQAEVIAGQVRIETVGANVYADGPSTSGEQSWAVSYEIFVPRVSNLSLKTHNGGIGITGVRGQIQFDALNGGVSLKGLAGNVRGTTRNGGLSIELDGNRWEGDGLDVTTTNGGVKMTIPENYSARLETGTVNGGMKFDFPVTVQGDIKRELSVNLGGGGATIKARTTNGGILIKRKA